MPRTRIDREQSCIYNSRNNWPPTSATSSASKYQIDLPNIAIDQPPKIEMGEFAMPFPSNWPSSLRKPPRKIAEEIVAEMPLPEGFDRSSRSPARDTSTPASPASRRHEKLTGGAAIAVTGPHGEGAADVTGKILVEHTSINPNKAAHIGHLRNAILGDTFVRLLRAAGHAVDMQNYIDNTGVQVADVVVGFVQLQKKSKAEIEELIASTPRFDYYCWDLYARVSQWYEEDKDNLKARLETLHAIEQGNNEMADDR